MAVSILILLFLQIISVELRRSHHPRRSDLTSMSLNLKGHQKFYFYPNASHRNMEFTGHHAQRRILNEIWFRIHSSLADDKAIARYERNPDDTKFHLYTRANRRVAQTLLYRDKKSIQKSNFGKKRVTVILVHGWYGDHQTDMNEMLTRTFLDKSDVNVIGVDWGSIAKSVNYATARHAVVAAGRVIGAYVAWLVSNGYAKYSRIHLVGFSLGAHVSGNIGRNNKGKIARITALDPAGPLWSGANDRLAPTDARYVEVIHTNSQVAGLSDALGDADFYPNLGTSQPNCDSFTSVIGCSHYRAFELMDSSLKYNRFEARKCTSYELLLLRKDCHGSTAYMGNDELKKSARGLYFLKTTGTYPYF